MANPNKFTAKEVLNKVLLDSSGDAVTANSVTSQEALNSVLDTTNNRLNMSLAGGTISGDVTISGDLTVQGGGSLSFDEIIEGTQVIDVTSTEALLVRKNGDGGDIFIVDTTNGDVTVQNSGDAVLSLTSTHANGNTFFDMTNTGTGDSYIRWASDSNSSLIFSKSSGTTSILKLDNSNNATFAGKIGIGTSGTPAQMLHIASPTDAFIQLERVDTTVANNDAIGAILFRGGESSIADIGRIRLHADADFTSSSSPTKMIFETTPSGATADAVALTLDSSQNAIFGGELDVNPATNKRIKFTFPTDEYANESRIGFSDLNAHITYKAQNNFMEIWSYSSLFLQTGSSATTALSIDSSQNATFASNIVVSSGVIQLADLAQSIDFIQSGAINYDSNNDQTGREFKIGFNRSAGSSGGTTNLCLDENSVISLSNNDSGGTGGSDSTSGNTLMGYLAGDNIASGGVDNTFYGHEAGAGNTTGDYNTALGSLSGQYNQTGSQNTYVGYASGLGASGNSHTTNTAVGYFTLKDVTTGGANTVIGAFAGDVVTTQDSLTLVGKNAGGAISHNNANGSVAVGASALAGCVSGEKNVSIGFESSLASTGDYNTVMGTGAFKTADGGESANVVIGKEAGMNINHASSDHNVIIGTDAGTGGAGEFSYNVAIGSNALNSTTTNTIQGQVAIGYDALTALTSGTNNVAVGFDCLKSVNTGGSNTAVGKFAGDTLTDGTENTIVGYGARTDDASATNQIVLGRATTGVEDHSVTLGNSSVTAVYMAEDSGATVHCLSVALAGGILTFSSDSELTISSGAVTATKNYHTLDTEGGAGTDDLDTINGGSDGQLLILRDDSNNRDVTAKDGTGNLALAGDFTFTNSLDTLTLLYCAGKSEWLEISRSNNA